jgi:hypothetical protein
MGIDIYLNGYEAFNERVALARAAFEMKVKERDALPSDSPAREKVQDEVEQAYDAMYRGEMGYIRSSYNGSGLFRRLEEIYGFDIAAYLFPGDWKEHVPVNGEEFVRRVETLQQTAILAMERHRRALPWIDLFTETSGERAPDANESRTRGELFGEQVFATLSALDKDLKVEPEPQPAANVLSAHHGWYLTRGLGNLLAFGQLAREMNAAGVKTFAMISY